MSSISQRRLRIVAATLASAALVATAASAISPSTANADPSTDATSLSPASTVGKQVLAVDFDRQDTTIDRGAMFGVSGTVHQVTQGSVGRFGAGVPASFTLQVVDATGRVLGTQAVTSGTSGSFSTTVPGSITAKLPSSGEDLHLAVRAVNASATGGYAAKSAGATPVTVRAASTGLKIQDSFVSSVGWVKPGDTYPSRIILTNTSTKKVTGAKVTISAPKGSTIKKTSGSGSHKIAKGRTITWKPAAIPAKKGNVPGQSVLVVLSKAASTTQLDTIVWRDLSTTAKLVSKGRTTTVASHGPKVIPPSETFATARYGDRPFPVVPLQYTDRSYQSDHSGSSLAGVINDPKKVGSTFNLYQEMSLNQLYPDGTVPSEGIATASFDGFHPAMPFTQIVPGQTCHGATMAGLGAEGTPLYPARITNGVYNLPGNTDYYGDDANGSALTGALAGVGALQAIDSGCGPTAKIVADAVALADPEIDYSDYDTDKDGIVDFFMGIYAGCGGNGESQLTVAACPYTDAPYDNIWPHSSTLEGSYTDPKTGLPGVVTNDQDKDLEGHPLYYKDKSYQATTTKKTAYPVMVRVGPYNLNPETAVDHASVISHEYGHSLGLPDFYTTGSRETYGDWNLMATDKSQNMDAFSRQELGWVVPQVLKPGTSKTIKKITDSKQDIHKIFWKTAKGKSYTLKNGRDGKVHNSTMFVAKLPGRQLLAPAVFDTGDKATKKRAWFSGSGNDFGCATGNTGHNLDFSIPGLSSLPQGSTVKVDFKSNWDIEWDFDYGFVLTSTDGGKNFVSHPSANGYTTSNADPTAGNPNQNGCQAAYDNGITGTSASYRAGTQATDRKAGNFPAGVFVSDSYDISDLVGAATPVLRFSYSTDPGLARPGWFIDDLKVTATLPGGATKVLYATNFEKTGGPDDRAVFNGGCQGDNPGSNCTKGWQYVTAGDEADFDHAYYLELRDRSGFDDTSHGENDRDPIGWTPGLYLSYTDEAHGYGNVGTDDPPAQSPLDATPTPGSETPNLNDAAFTTAKGRSLFSDFGVGHTDNYTDPSEEAKDPRYSDVDNPWRFQYDCLKFQVTKMSGTDIGPQKSNGNLTGDVKFTMGKASKTGCGTFDYGYATGVAKTAKNTRPVAKIVASPGLTVRSGQVITFSGTKSTDKETPRGLQYIWNFGDKGNTKDATGPVVRHSYTTPGNHNVRLTVQDPSGAMGAMLVHVTVTAGRSIPPMSRWISE